MELKNKSIELEFRAEIKPDSFAAIIADLGCVGKMISHTKRLSVMFLGKISGQPFDIRVRIDDGQRAEIVLKKAIFILTTELNNQK